MKTASLLLLVLTTILVSNSKAADAPVFISNTKQLTFDGSRAGEGYFSADGKKLIYQSERDPKNPFYQIFLMDLKTGESKLLSPGFGSTTCSWVHPDNNKVLFSSTHLDKAWKKKAENEFRDRKSGQKKKYSWSFDDTYEIFEKNLKTGALTALTKTKGYDAEASYSPDGKWIAFASDRKAYTEKLSEEEKKLFSQDPSYMMDIFIMKEDGSNIRQLTNVRGYDGGPFFSADGKKITWRRFSPNGQSAEIYTMNVDGTNQKQITKMGAMSWAPFFHPSGDYIVFTTNILGYSNFELYMVDSEGLKEPVRVTDLADFDGLPTFSPDGHKISWTHRDAKGESQIYIADWDDILARQTLGLEKAAPRLADDQIKSEDVKQWIYYLASDKLKGRRTGSPEEDEYTGKISKIFKDLGFELIPSEFEFTSGVKLGDRNLAKAVINKESLDLKLNRDFMPLSFSKNGRTKNAPLIFAGYGIKAPATATQKEYDSFKDIDVRDKWVLILRDIPENVPNPRRIYFNVYSRINNKAMIARNLGAAGVILVSGSQYKTAKLPALKFDGSAGDVGIPVIQVTNEIADKLLKPSGKKLFDLQKDLDDEKMLSVEVKETEIVAHVDLIAQRAKGRNVLAKLSVPNAKSTILIGAHGDALGFGQDGNSLARGEEKDRIHYGADDNASGVAAVMELAGSFAALKKEKKLKSNLIFGIWSGEEIGILGSSAFLNQHPKLKLDAYVNLDMVGRLKDKLNVQGIGSGTGWKSQIEKVAAKNNLDLSLQEDPYLPSDAMAFYLKGYPTVMMFTGAHSEYHTPRDTANLINYEGVVKVANLVQDLTMNLGASDKFPIKYVKVEGSRGQQQRRSFRIYLGTIPDYAQDGIKGVKISGTSKDSPAEKAGLKTGDIILELAGQKIENLYDYVYCLQAIKPNQQTTVKVNRSGQIRELEILPVLKE